MWTDGRCTDGHRRTVSDHNSSLSTSCSGELKYLLNFPKTGDPFFMSYFCRSDIKPSPEKKRFHEVLNVFKTGRTVAIVLEQFIIKIWNHERYIFNKNFFSANSISYHINFQPGFEPCHLY